MSTISERDRLTRGSWETNEACGRPKLTPNSGSRRLEVWPVGCASPVGWGEQHLTKHGTPVGGLD